MTTLSKGLREVMLDQFDASQLRELAALSDSRSARAMARLSLSRASAEELADMIVSGRKATVGWWRRNSRKATP